MRSGGGTSCTASASRCSERQQERIARRVADHPYERFVEALRARGCLSGRGVKVTATQTRAICPVSFHADVNASLTASRREDRVLIHCHAGCGGGKVLAALGMRFADLYVEPDGRRRRATQAIVARYEYVNLAGEIVGWQIRRQPKGFKWQHPDPSGRRAWLWGLGDVKPSLYRLPELIDCPRVFLVEGEKAVDLLWSLGLQPSCPPSGAARWMDAWTDDLVTVGCRELVILPDHDAPGDEHAERVAEAVHRVIPVRVVRLDGLSRGADVVDWLAGGHTPAELVDAAVRASYWFQGQRQQQRDDRRRHMTGERVRRMRARNATNVQPVTPVTLVTPVRTSKKLQESLISSDSSDIQSVTPDIQSVTDRASDAPTEANAAGASIVLSTHFLRGARFRGGRA
jgi:hypothetical protein